MRHINPHIYRTASIQETPGSATTITLHLHVDHDGQYRWYHADGTDTDRDVAGPTVADAIDAGQAAWRDRGLVVPESI